jgi:hypothetical protein
MSCAVRTPRQLDQPSVAFNNNDRPPESAADQSRSRRPRIFGLLRTGALALCVSGPGRPRLFASILLLFLDGRSRHFFANALAAVRAAANCEPDESEHRAKRQCPDNFRDLHGFFVPCCHWNRISPRTQHMMTRIDAGGVWQSTHVRWALPWSAGKNEDTNSIAVIRARSLTSSQRQNEAHTATDRRRTIITTDYSSIRCPDCKLNPIIGTATPILRHTRLSLWPGARYSSGVVDDRLLCPEPRAQCRRFARWRF